MGRFLIRFTKNREAKFISHLDLMRTLTRAFRRASIPVAYSKGFNPHPNISLAAPLPVGVSSDCEYGDIEIDVQISGNDIRDRVNPTLTAGIQILSAVSILEKQPPSMALVEAARYKITFEGNLKGNKIDLIVEKILSETQILKLKKTKSGEKEVDIRPLILELKGKQENAGNIIFECILCTGSKANLNPEVLAALIREYSDDSMSGYADINRLELYTMGNNELMNIERYYLGK